jgi:regulator of replication initiation timing
VPSIHEQKLVDIELSKEEIMRKEVQIKIEEELRARLGREKRFKTMMAKYEKEDQIKYKKLALNLAGLREYGFDSYGNPITIRNDKPTPTNIEIIKP